MAKWSITGTVMAGTYIGEVEADSKDEALEKAEKMDMDLSLCHECARKMQEPEVTELHAEEL